MERPKHTAPSFLGACVATGLLLQGCGEPKPSLTEALKADADAELAKTIKTKPRPRPDGLPPPTDAELRAWDRKDPGGEKHLYKWDKKNITKMVGYWQQLECFRDKIKEEGEKAFGAEPGTPQEEQWFQFKRTFIIPIVDSWQKRLFANEPRILEKSKFIGNFLEAHELIMRGYPEAYNNSDRTEVDKNDAHWIIVQNKNKKYTKNLGAGKEWPEWDLENPKDVKAKAKVCEEALTPPDPKAKKKRKGKKSPI